MDQELRALERRYSSDPSLQYALVGKYMQSGHTELEAFERIYQDGWGRERRVNDALLKFLMADGLDEIRAYERIYFLRYGDAENLVTAKLIYTGMPDYWSGDGDCHNETSCCTHVWFGPITTLKDIIIDTEAEAGAYCEQLPEEITDLHVRLALFEMLTPEGQISYLDDSVFEAAKYSYSDFYSVREAMMEEFDKVALLVDSNHPGFDDAERAYESIKDFDHGDDEIIDIMEYAVSASKASNVWADFQGASSSLDETCSDEHTPVAIILFEAIQNTDTLTLY
jgi:hypothetical protein